MTVCWPRFGPPIAAILALALVSCGDEEGASTTTAGKASSRVDTARGVVFANDAFERIRIEAESAQKVEGSLMRVVEDSGASGGKCLFIADKAGTPKEGKLARALYTFTVKEPGNYTFWCRRKWHDQCGDTFAVRFDQVGRPHSEAFLFGADDSSKPPRWGWTPVRENGKQRQFFFTAGKHVMEILNREDGPRFDVVLLTDDRDYVPQGIEE